MSRRIVVGGASGRGWHPMPGGGRAGGMAHGIERCPDITYTWLGLHMAKPKIWIFNLVSGGYSGQAGQKAASGVSEIVVGR